MNPSPGKFVLHYIQARRTEFGALLLLVVLAAVSAVVMQYQMKRLVDAMADITHSVAPVWSALSIFIALMASESLLLRAGSWMACRSTIGAGVQIRLDLFNQLAGHSTQYFADNLAGSLGQRTTGTAGAFGALINTAAWRIVPPVVDFIGALVIFSAINAVMAGVLGACVAAAIALLLVAGKGGRELHSAYHRQASQVAGSLIDVISNIWAVKAFTAQRRESDRLREQFGAEAAVQKKSWLYAEKTRITYDAAVWIIASLMAYWAVHAWSRHSITPGDVLIITALTFRILHGSRDVSLALVEAGLQFSYIDDTLKSVGRVHTVRDTSGAAGCVAGPAKIAFKNVTFGYGVSPVLRNVNLTIHPGEKVGIVGASGAGKTTIIQLIQRLCEPQSGQILLDDRPLDAYSQDALRSALAVVPQEISLFHRSIMDNIRFGRPEASDEEVHAAGRAAQCEEFVLQLPDGYATLVGERGVKLSGGQRQRVGIARAFLRNAQLLILDESTSALDTTSELRVQRSITHWLRDRTVVAVAHRLSTLSSYDRILVIDNGRVVEEGKPAELKQGGKLFRSMWHLQANGEEVGA